MDDPGKTAQRLASLAGAMEGAESHSEYEPELALHLHELLSAPAIGPMHLMVLLHNIDHAVKTPKTRVVTELLRTAVQRRLAGMRAGRLTTEGFLALNAQSIPRGTLAAWLANGRITESELLEALKRLTPEKLREVANAGAREPRMAAAATRLVDARTHELTVARLELTESFSLLPPANEPLTDASLKAFAALSKAFDNHEDRRKISGDAVPRDIEELRAEVSRRLAAKLEEPPAQD